MSLGNAITHLVIILLLCVVEIGLVVWTFRGTGKAFRSYLAGVVVINSLIVYMAVDILLSLISAAAGR